MVVLPSWRHLTLMCRKWDCSFDVESSFPSLVVLPIISCLIANIKARCDYLHIIPLLEHIYIVMGEGGGSQCHHQPIKPLTTRMTDCRSSSAKCTVAGFVAFYLCDKSLFVFFPLSRSPLFSLYASNYGSLARS